MSGIPPRSFFFFFFFNLSKSFLPLFFFFWIFQNGRRCVFFSFPEVYFSFHHALVWRVCNLSNPSFPPSFSILFFPYISGAPFPFFFLAGESVVVGKWPSPHVGGPPLKKPLYVKRRVFSHPHVPPPTFFFFGNTFFFFFFFVLPSPLFLRLADRVSLDTRGHFRPPAFRCPPPFFGPPPSFLFFFARRCAVTGPPPMSFFFFFPPPPWLRFFFLFPQPCFFFLNSESGSSSRTFFCLLNFFCFHRFVVVPT